MHVVIVRCLHIELLFYEIQTTGLVKFSYFSVGVKMYTSRKKIHKDKDAEPTEFEESVGQVLFRLPWTVAIALFIGWYKL